MLFWGLASLKIYMHSELLGCKPGEQCSSSTRISRFKSQEEMMLQFESETYGG
jgi:hypothetical protein